MAALLTPPSRPNPKAHGTLMKVKLRYLRGADHLTSKLLVMTSYLLIGSAHALRPQNSGFCYMYNKSYESFSTGNVFPSLKFDLFKYQDMWYVLNQHWRGLLFDIFKHYPKQCTLGLYFKPLLLLGTFLAQSLNAETGLRKKNNTNTTQLIYEHK